MMMLDPCKLPCGHKICMSCVVEKSIETKLKCPIDNKSIGGYFKPTIDISNYKMSLAKELAYTQYRIKECDDKFTNVKLVIKNIHKEIIVE